MFLIVLFDAIIRFIVYFLLLFILIVLLFVDKNNAKSIKDILSFKSIISILIITFILFCFDFFVFSIKPSDENIKKSYCNKKENLSNIKPDKLKYDPNDIYNENKDFEVQKSNEYTLTENIKQYIKPYDEKNKILSFPLSDESEKIEMEYTDANHLYVPPDYKTKPEDIGYVYLMPEKWYPKPPVPPVCMTNKKYYVSPVVAYDANLKKIGKPY